MIDKQGLLTIDTNKKNHYLLPNFSNTGSLSGWGMGSGITLTNGVAVMSGTAPSFVTSSFVVEANDIIAFEFDLAVPTPSTTSGPGIYIGPTYGVACNLYLMSSTGQYWLASSSNTNSYFIYGYNSTENIHIKTYLLGYNVDINTVPKTEANNYTLSNIYTCQLPTDTTSISLRTGYNANTSMVIHFSNPKIYKINTLGINEESKEYGSIGDSFISGKQIYEF